jgi:hypothetical protein
MDWKTPEVGDELANDQGAIGFTAGMLTGDLSSSEEISDDVIDADIVEDATERSAT